VFYAAEALGVTGLHSSPMRVFAFALVFAAAGLVGAVAASGSGRFGTFQMPSHNIVCQFVIDERPAVECGIRSGLVGARVTDCSLGDPQTNRVEVGKHGRADRVRCAGDAGPFTYPTAPVIAYGQTWQGGGLSCRSAISGLTCRNVDGHGFFLSRQRWRLF
jgi:hypothetical protein